MDNNENMGGAMPPENKPMDAAPQPSQEPQADQSQLSQESQPTQPAQPDQSQPAQPSQPDQPQPDQPAPQAQPQFQSEAQPNFGMPSQPQSQPQPFQSQPLQSQPAQPAKKKAKKGPIIAAVAAGAVLVLGGGGFGIAYAITNTPENAALSAIANFVSAGDMGMEGSYELSSGDSENILESVKVNLTGAKNSDMEGEISGAIEVVFNGKTYKLTLTSAYLKDNSIYISLKDLETLFEQIAAEVRLNYDTASDTTGFYDKVEEMLGELVGEIDGQYWRINYFELIDTYGEMSTKDKKAYKEYYECMYNSMKAEYDSREDYIDVYKASPFLTFSNYEGKHAEEIKEVGKLYTVKVDTKNLETFLNNVANREVSKKVAQCYDDLSAVIYDGYYDLYYGDDDEEQEHNDIKLGDVTYPDEIVIAVDGLFSHKLTGFYLFDEDDGTTNEISIKFSYDKQNISVPENYRDITELADLIKRDIEKFTDALYDYQEAQYSGYDVYYDGDVYDYDNCSPGTNCVSEYEEEI